MNERATQAEITFFNTSHGQVQVYWKEETAVATPYISYLT